LQAIFRVIRAFIDFGKPLPKVQFHSGCRAQKMLGVSTVVEQLDGRSLMLKNA
jgi:predicted DNA-binding antitoxin AbrB/MazE fold protein